MVISIPELPQIENKKAGNLYSRGDLLKVIAEYLTEALPRVGFQEDFYWADVRIILCIVICGLGCCAQFGTKFPQDRDLLMLLVCGFLALLGLLAVLDWIIFGSSVMCIKVGDVSVFVDVSMPSFTANLNITLRSTETSRKESLDTTAANYFDSDGYLRQKNLFEDVMTLIRQFEKSGRKAGEIKRNKPAHPRLKFGLFSVVLLLKSFRETVRSCPSSPNLFQSFEGIFTRNAWLVMNPSRWSVRQPMLFERLRFICQRASWKHMTLCLSTRARRAYKSE